MSPEAMCRANKASFTLSFKIINVASPVDQEIAHAIKHAGREKALADKGSHLGASSASFTISETMLRQI